MSISINCLFVRVQTQFILLTLTSYDVGVKRYFDPSDTELLRALHSRNSKTFVIRSFFFKKWLLTHVLAGPKFENPPASKLVSDF